MAEQEKQNDALAWRMVVSKLDDVVTKQDRLENNMTAHFQRMNDAMTQLAVIAEKQITLAERHIQLQEQINKMTEANRVADEKIDNRLDALEKEMPQQKQVAKWFLTAVWTAAAGAVMFIAKAVGFLT